MHLYIARHGMTDHNFGGRFHGGDGTGLNDRGKSQAYALAVYLREFGLPLAHIYCSDMPRAAETARIVSSVLGTRIVETAALREIDLGAWSGMAYREVAEKYSREYGIWQNAPLQFKLPGGESVAEVQSRTATFYNQMLQSHADSNILLISHSVAISVLVSYIHNWDLQQAWTTNRARHSNAALTHIYIDALTFALIESDVARTHHLDHLDYPGCPSR